MLYTLHQSTHPTFPKHSCHPPHTQILINALSDIIFDKLCGLQFKENQRLEGQPSPAIFRVQSSPVQSSIERCFSGPNVGFPLFCTSFGQVHSFPLISSWESPGDHLVKSLLTRVLPTKLNKIHKRSS